MNGAQRHQRGPVPNICPKLQQVGEACPNQLEPTSSTTLQTVLRSAMAVALIEERGLSRSDFLRLNPAGA